MDWPNRRHVLALAAAAPIAGLAGGCMPRRVSHVPAGLDASASFLDGLVANGRLPGGGIRISRNGEVLLEHFAGKADIGSGRDIAADTIYRAYSMTKPVTAAAIMLLVDEDKVALEDPVARHVPEFDGLSVMSMVDGEMLESGPAGEMRISHLLAHTSGLGNSWSPGPIAQRYRQTGLISTAYPYDPAFADGLPEVAKRLGEIPLQFEPGTQWFYSISTDIAGLVVERASGQSFGTFLKKRLFEPLEMPDTGFHVPTAKADRLASVYTAKTDGLSLREAAQESPFLNQPYVESGSAGLVTTLGDYGRFAAMLAGLGRTRGVRVLSEASARTMLSPQVQSKVLGARFGQFMDFATGGSGRGMSMALGGAVLADPSASDIPGVQGEYTWGGAASTTFFAVPELGLEATLMTQLFPSGTIPLRDLLKQSVYEALR